jgi:hypothetical protein
LHCFVNSNKKVETDIKKQLCYEFSLKKSNSNYYIIQNHFFIPWFKTKNQTNSKDLHQSIIKNGLGVSKGNFMKIQAIYLNV